MTEELKKYIRSVPDFPKPGVLFYDIGPLLADPETFGRVIDEMASLWKDASIDCIGAFDARGCP
ncbi:adenine phosphoribosyltransferase, partial [bacterium]|nr:adenine phosphoribosyltransferase [bacterium]